MDALSGSDDVCISFKVLLNDAQERLALPGLEQVSFFYDVPDEGLGVLSAIVGFIVGFIVASELGVSIMFIVLV